MKWFKVSSMERCVLSKCRFICDFYHIKNHYSDNGIDPPAVFMLCYYSEYTMIIDKLGLHRR